MREHLQSLLSAILALTAAAIGVVLVHREFYSAVRPNTVELGLPRYLPGWRELVATGRVVGDSGAAVKIVEFSDLECPVCRSFDRSLREVRKRHPKEVALVFVHFPLPGHRFARPAAQAAECANRAGRFAEFVETVYDKQDSLGLKPWTSYAQGAGIADTLTFAHCVAESAAMPQIEAGIALGKKIGVHGTPTVVVNGWRFGSPPAEADLQRTVASLLAGERPFSGDGANARP